MITYKIKSYHHLRWIKNDVQFAKGLDTNKKAFVLEIAIKILTRIIMLLQTTWTNLKIRNQMHGFDINICSQFLFNTSYIDKCVYIM